MPKPFHHNIMFFRTIVWPQKGPPAKMSTWGSKNPIMGSYIRPWAWKHKRCALKNHAESSPWNSKRSHTVEVMAQKHFGGLSKYWYILGGKSCSQGILFPRGEIMHSKQENPAFKKGNPACKKGNPAFKKGNPACKKGNPACKKGKSCIQERENPAFKKGNPNGTNGTRDRD